MTDGFGERLLAAFDASGPLCVGVDAHPYLLAEWGLPDSAAGAREFGLRVIDATRTRAAIVKPQVAFFERHGSAGYAALEEVLAAARAAGLVVIADVKRGDVGSTVAAYAQAWLTPGSPLETDAMTVSAYQGLGSLSDPIAAALSAGKGMFVLAATSNPESFELQRSIARGGASVASSIVSGVATVNRERDHARLGSLGVVLGATVELSSYGIEPHTLSAGTPMPILAPGFGHQGAEFGQIGALYGKARSQLVVSVSRSILAAGPDDVSAAIDRHRRELAQWRG